MRNKLEYEPLTRKLVLLLMTDAEDSTAKLKDEQSVKKKREEALPERLLRRVLEGMGSVVDRRLGRTVDPRSGLTTSKLIERMKRLIDERVRDEGNKGRIAPHHLVLKVEWGTHSEAPPEILYDLKNEVLAAAIDHINDHRYRTLAPVDVEAEVDIFTTGISVDPNFGEFEEDLRRQDEEMRAARTGVPIPGAAPPMPDIQVTARVTMPNGTREIPLIFKPGGRRLNVGRASDNDLTLNDSSVSKIHAALLMTTEGTLLVADTGSTNGTYLNGRRISYGESRLVEDGDVVGFGDVEVRLRKSE
ncbi:MAG TPA: FHA domain-containing protein [Pyrinomonadaceae bacterium]|nr:FHA domain-containing protein [Pyrinomonadaceae bacterium]